MKFIVRAVTGGGEQYTDILEAEDRFSVYNTVRDRGDRVLSLKEKRKNDLLSFDSFTSLFRRISLDEKVVVTRNLAAMVEAGLTISRALEVMGRQTHNAYLKEVLSDIVGNVKRGEAFSSVLSSFTHIFSPLIVSMVRAGEESGKLTEALRVASLQMERASNLQKKIRGALIYPSIVLSAMLGIGIIMLITVVPILSKTFTELHAKLPSSTQFVLTVSSTLTHHPVLSLVVASVFIFSVVFAFRTKKGRAVLDFILLRTPIIGGLIIEINAARTTRTLASLLSSGVDMVLSVKITKDVLENAAYKAVLAEAEESLASGAPLSATFSKHSFLYPPLVGEIIAVGEETGRLSDLLKETAEFYEESVERQTKDLSTVIEPFLMIVIGGAVGFFALAMIAPIYSLSNSI